MSNIIPGRQAYGEDLPPSGFDLDWTILSNVSITTYASGTPGVNTNFTAPASGRVLVATGCGIRNNSAANADRVSITYEIYEDSFDGPLIVPAELRSGVLSNGTLLASDFHYVGGFRMESGLTPGKNYFIRMVYRTILGSATADIASRNISIIPLP